MWRIESRALFSVLILLIMVASVTPTKMIWGTQQSICKQLKELGGNPGSSLDLVSCKNEALNKKEIIIWDKAIQSAIQVVQKKYKFNFIRVRTIAGYESKFKVSVDVPKMELHFAASLDEIRPKKNSKKPYGSSSFETRLEFLSKQLKVLNIQCPDNNSSLVNQLSFSDSVEELSVNAGSLSDFAVFLSHYTHLKTYRFLNTLEANCIQRNRRKVIEVQSLNPDVVKHWDEILKRSKMHTTWEIVRSPESTSFSGSIPSQNESIVVSKNFVGRLPQLERKKSPEKKQRPTGNGTTSSNPLLQDHGAAPEPNSTLPNDSAPSKPSEPHQQREVSAPSESTASTTLDPASATQEEPVLHADPTVNLVLRLSILIGVCFFFPIIVALCIYRRALSSYHAEVARSFQAKRNIMYI